MVRTEPEIRRTRSCFLRFSICIETKIENNRQGITFSCVCATAESNWMGSKSQVSNKSGIFVFPKVFKEFVLDNQQKLKIVENFDRAQTVREIKPIKTDKNPTNVLIIVRTNPTGI